MVLKPDLNSWTFADLEELQDNKITESNFVDYKRQVNSDQDLIKMICGFANANGGFLIIGVEESEEEPAYPVGFPGISPDQLNTQRLEQIINTNIAPRLPVHSRVLDVPSSPNKILIIYVPDGPEKPYYSLKTHRFYLRYNWETREMTEAEISARYRERFTSEDRIEAYIRETIRHHQQLCPEEVEAEDFADRRNAVYAHLFVYPPNVTRRRVETTDRNLFNLPRPFMSSVMKAVNIYGDFIPGQKRPSRFGVEWSDTPGKQRPVTRLEVHRNGLIHWAAEYGYLSLTGITQEPRLHIDDGRVVAHLIGLLELADHIYREIEYYGPVIIRLQIPNAQGLRLREERAQRVLGLNAFLSAYRPTASRSEEIIVEREWNSWELGNDFAVIAKSIMDEFSNHFGLWEYPEFLPKGEFHSLLKESEA